MYKQSTGHIKQAFITFNSIKKYGLTPDTISYITMINGIIKNNFNSEEYAKEIIYLVKESISDEIIFQNNFYMKIIHYIKNNAPNLSDEFIKYLQSSEVFNYQYKENKNKIYNSNDVNNNVNEINEPEKENNEGMSNNKGNFINNGYDTKSRRPLRLIYKSNYTGNNYYNGQNNNSWKNKGYKNNSDYNKSEVHYEYKDYNDFGEKVFNSRLKNSYNKEKNFYYKKKGNNYY